MVVPIRHALHILTLLMGLALPALTGAAESADRNSPMAFPDVHSAALALPRLHSLLISHRGDIVFEEYYSGRTARQPDNMKSASKSVISALIGIAIDEGLIESVDVPIAKYLPEYISAQQNADK